MENKEIIPNKKKKPVRLIVLLIIMTLLLSGILAYKPYKQKKNNDENIYNEKYPCAKEWDKGNPCGGVVPEEHGKVAVAKLDFVQKLVSDYGVEQIEISALGYQFIDDDAYIKRLLGGKYPNIDCIIPVKWPDGEVVYIEVINNGVEEYIQISGEEFEESIAGAAEEDVQILYDNMNSDQTYVRQVMNSYK